MIFMNYNLMMENIIDKLDYRPKLLMHACCGICSSSVLERLIPYFDITVLYYNPNTYPYLEYKKRLDTLKELVNKMGNNVSVLEIGYEEEKFIDISRGFESEREGGKRCIMCYRLRLEKAARYAKENGFDYFCTTLSVSPHKNSFILNNIGRALQNKYKINYLFSDFKKKNGFKRSNELSRFYNLYRQDYCGCKYSLRDSKNH